MGVVKRKKIHWCSWEKLCRPKWEGGLGFRNLGTFNKAMLAKQCWRIIQFPDSLAARVLKGCYFNSSSVLSARGVSGSFLWKNLLWGRELVDKGSRWRIGGGSSVRIYKDRWVP